MVVGWVAFSTLLMAVSSRAETNSWVKSTSGNWDEPGSWKLGILPASSQSVAITNAGEKTVVINLATTQNYPASLTVNDLTVSGTNTLLLDNPGTTVPLQVLKRLSVGPDGQVVQIGGFAQAGGVLMFGNGKYYLTNGIFEAGDLSFIYPASFSQVGGAASMKSLGLYAGSYSLAGGDLVVSAGISVYAQYGSAAFSQEGGTIRTLSLSLGSPPIGAAATYSMNAGSLASSNVSVGPRCAFSQNGGVHSITDTLRIEGSARYYPPVPIPASYRTTGSLYARSLVIAGVFSHFSTSGTTIISESLQFIGSRDLNGSVSITGGTLACSNVLNSGGGADIGQSGGAFIVTNLFSFAGYEPGIFNSAGRYARYNFSGGTLTVSNMDLAAEMIIGSSTQAGRITNSGYFQLAGTLRVGDADEHLGPLILASNATINLGDGRARVTFANSSGENWNGAAKLIVTNWSGATNGGGDDQLKFGNDASGLIPSQLSQIRFVNPAGLAPGAYLARILSTGEMVPLPGPTLSFVRTGTNLALRWTANFLLQAATNVTGPYEDVPAASSGYTNSPTGSLQRYFRLRQ